MQLSRNRVQGNDPGFQPGGLDQRINEAVQLAGLSIQRIQARFAARLLPEELRIQENVGHGRFGLMGDVPNEGLELFLFRCDLPRRGRGGGEIVRQLALQRRKQGLVKAVLREIPLHGGIQHAVHGFQRPSGAAALPGHRAEGQNTDRRHDRVSPCCHLTSPPMYSRCRRPFSGTSGRRGYPPACRAAA